MKRFFLALALLLPASAFAQTTEAGARLSVSADYKIVKKLHLKAEEELRIGDNFGALNSTRTSLALTYKYKKIVKFGVGYTLINPYQPANQAFGNPRHRLFADVTGYLPLGDFQLSLKERLQLTHRTGNFNVYQTTPNALALKSKLTLKYKGWDKVEPYAAFELRTALNDPWGSTTGAQQATKKGKLYYTYVPAGYTHVYNNRYRVNLGADIAFNKHHTLTPYVLLDFCSDYEIDTNSKGTRFFSAAYVNTFKPSVGLSYEFSF